MVIVDVVLAALLVFAAARKLSHREEVVRQYARVHVPKRWLTPLAAVLLAGAAGLVGGLFVAPLGVAAAAGVLAYFVVAAGFHVRARDWAGLPVPVVLAALAAASLAL